MRISFIRLAGYEMFYWIIRFLILVAARVVYRMKVSGAENIPKEGSFILCSNHIHSYDPAMLAISMNRQMRFMAKKELFKWRLKGAFFRSVGAFPVDREAADMTSYRNAMGALKSGMGLLIFSQGTRMHTLNIKNVKGGVALFAVKSKAPIIPAGISGSYLPFSVLDIRFGQAINLEGYDGRLKTDQIDEIMGKVMSEVENLLV